MKKLIVLVAIFFPLIVMAEPMPNMLYVDDEASECGYIWGGDEYVEYEPVDSRWEESRWLMEEPTDPAKACEELGYNYVGEIEAVEMYTDLGEDLVEDYGEAEIVYNDETYWEYWIAGLVVILSVAFLLIKRRN